jgi:uncharacterized protein
MSLSAAAKERMLSVRGEPLFYATWDGVVMIHYEVDPGALQRCVPFELDLRDGQAFVSLVGFTMRGMRPRRGGRIGAWLLRPIATHEFMNVRTYVRAKGETGIYFLAEWLSNRISVPLGPPLFGLPYRYGQIAYHRGDANNDICGEVAARGRVLSFGGRIGKSDATTCAVDSFDEFVMERYTAFTERLRTRRMFRVWHAPWQQVAVDAEVTRDDLLSAAFAWWPSARITSANYSPGVDVWMGRPLRLPRGSSARNVSQCFSFSGGTNRAKRGAVA